MTKLRLQDQHPALQAAIADPTVAMVYRPGVRIYGVPKIKEHNLPRRVGFAPGKRVKVSIWYFDFCPFSGELLPGDLADIVSDRLQQETGLGFWDLLYDLRHRRKWGRSEDWWINEGIGPNPDKEILALKDKPPEWPYVMNTPLPENAHKVMPGYRLPDDEPEHYCRGLSYVWRYDGMFWYLPYTREYGPRIIDPNKRIDYQPIRILPVPYCPWCGTKLPKSKRPAWEKRVRKAGFDPNAPEAEGFPPHLLRDGWWRKHKR